VNAKAWAIARGGALISVDAGRHGSQSSSGPH